MRERGNTILRRGNGVEVGVRSGREGMMIDGIGRTEGVEVEGIWERGVGEIEIDMMIGIEIGGGVVKMIVIARDEYRGLLTLRLAFMALGAILR